MSSIPQIKKHENEISDFVTKFMKEFKVGKLLFQCNAGKLKGIPVIDVFRYLFCLIFPTEACICNEKQAFMMLDSVKIQFTDSSTVPKQTGFVLQRFFQERLSMVS